MPQRRDAKLLQVFRRQARKNRLVNLIFAERSLILSKAKAPQPNHDVHVGAELRSRSISSLEGPGEVLGGVGFGECARGSRGATGSARPLRGLVYTSSQLDPIFRNLSAPGLQRSVWAVARSCRITIFPSTTPCRSSFTLVLSSPPA